MAYGYNMKQSRAPTSQTLIRNLRFLMKQREWKAAQLAEKCGVSGRMINYILNGWRSCTVEIADRLAAPFGMSGWHLLMPNLREDLLCNGTLERLIQAYAQSEPDGRDLIMAVAEREAVYARKASSQI